MDEEARPTQNLNIQTVGEGAGATFHRVYSVDLSVDYECALATMADFQADINSFSPTLIARFEKTRGQPGQLAIGDEIMVHIAGPWNGPVRVTAVAKDSFRLITLEGHIEAGEIQFRIGRHGEKATRFEIESITKSKDQIVNFFYDKIRLAMLAQTEMWELVCEAFAREATDQQDLTPQIQVKTERQDPETGSWIDVSDQFGAHGTKS